MEQLPAVGCRPGGDDRLQRLDPPAVGGRQGADGPVAREHDPIAAEGFTLPGMLSELVGDRPQVLAELILHLHNNRNANTIAGAGAYRLASQFTGASVTAALADALSTQAPTLAAGTHETPTVLKQRPS